MGWKLWRSPIIGARQAIANGFADVSGSQNYTLRLTSRQRISYIDGMFSAHATVFNLSLASSLPAGAVLRLLSLQHLLRLART